jgi:hypothetical protein
MFKKIIALLSGNMKLSVRYNNNNNSGGHN